MASAASDGTCGAARRRVWSVALVAAFVVGGTAVGFALLSGLPAGLPHEAAAAVAKAAPAAGCQLSKSPSGYPDAYLRRAVPSGRHPPQPASGWHKPTEPMRFDKLFHSVFHGYLVITYRPGLPLATRASLRAWVLSHRGERVVGAPDATEGAPLLNFVEWGWQLRCASGVPSIAELDRFAARRASAA